MCWFITTPCLAKRKTWKTDAESVYKKQITIVADVSKRFIVAESIRIKTGLAIKIIAANSKLSRKLKTCKLLS